MERTLRTQKEIDIVSGHVADAAMKLHTALGPGLLESAYKTCLVHELLGRRLRVVSELTLPVTYDGVQIDAGYRVDLLVENTVVVEVKSVAKVLPVHEAQLLSYLKLGGYRVGLLINFQVRHLRYGITRMVNRY